jgi:hypothetical protein
MRSRRRQANTAVTNSHNTPTLSRFQHIAVGRTQKMALHLIQNEQISLNNLEKNQHGKLNESIQFRTAALVHVATAAVAVVHQRAEFSQCIGVSSFTHRFELQHAFGLRIDVRSPIVKFEVFNCDSIKSHMSLQAGSKAQHGARKDED